MKNNVNKYEYCKSTMVSFSFTTRDNDILQKLKSGCSVHNTDVPAFLLDLS